MTDEPKVGAPRATFDQAASERMRAAALEAMAAHPELRAVAVVFDYHGGLNDADVIRGVWLGEDGPVTRPDAVVGSMFQLMKMLELQCGRALGLINQLRETLEAAGSEVVRRHEEKEKEGEG